MLYFLTRFLERNQSKCLHLSPRGLTPVRPSRHVQRRESARTVLVRPSMMRLSPLSCQT